MKNNKVITYYRKSTRSKGKTEEESVAYQQARIQEYANENALTIVKEFFEVGVTGTIESRPELIEMYQYLEECEENIDEILFYSIDRFGRDMIVNIELLKKIVGKIGKATFIRERISTGGENFNVIFLLYSGIAESDRENLLRNLKDGRYAKVIRYGNFDGNYPPLGYIVERSTKRLVPKRDDFTNDELAKQELDIVKTIFYSYLFGKSLRQIAQNLNERFGYTKRGCEWNYKSVQYILNNPVYIGVLTGVLEQTEHYYLEESNVEPLIDPIVFTLVQKKLEYESTGRKQKNKKQMPTLIFCNFCGEILENLNDQIICHKCDTAEDAQSIMKVLLTKLEEYTNQKINIEMFEKIQQKLILQYRIKSWKMESHLKNLLKRKSEIQSLDISATTKNTMLSANTKLISDLMLENEIVKGIQYYFESLSKEQLKEEFTNKVKTNLLQLPFVSIVDLVDKEVIHLFLTNIMNGDSKKC